MPKAMSKKEKLHRRIRRKMGWKFASVVLFALVLVSMFTGGFKDFFGTQTTRGIGADKAADQTVDFINTNLLQGQATATLKGVTELDALYKVELEIQGQSFQSYVTKDGKFLFPQGIDLTEEPRAPSMPSEPSAPPTGSKVEVSVDDDPSIGPEDAPVTIVEFSDFECPYCGKVVPTVKQILKEYEGKVRLVFRDFPLGFHQNAQKAAEAAECADDQDKFWEYHYKLFENQKALDVSSLKQYAKDLGLDSSEFNTCLDSGKHEEEVKKDMAEGQSYGVSGTPAFFINGIKVSGAQPFGNFASIIDSELEG